MAALEGTSHLLATNDWLPPVTRNVAAHDPPALHDASGRPVYGKSSSPTARNSGGGICRRGGHLRARGNGHSSEQLRPPIAFSSTVTLLHPQSKRVGYCRRGVARLMAICRPPMTEQRSRGNRTRQQLVLQARRWRIGRSQTHNSQNKAPR